MNDQWKAMPFSTTPKQEKINMRETLYRSAISCRHEISKDQIILYADHGKEGNALSQLADRLEQAAQTSQKEKQKVLVDAITEVLRVLDSENEAIVDTVWTTRGDNETLWEHCSHALEQVTGIEYKPAEQLPLNLQSQAQQESLWQPIATAPKNTKIIVRYKNICGKDRTVFAKYLDKFTEEATKGTDCETDYCEDDDTFYCKEGWVELIDNWDEFSSVYFDSSNVPTHWMPLPPAGE